MTTAELPPGDNMGDDDQIVQRTVVRCSGTEADVILWDVNVSRCAVDWWSSNESTCNNTTYNMNASLNDSGGRETGGEKCGQEMHNIWALLLVVFPLFTIVGNSLVVLSVVKEKSLRTATNYFIISLAISDIMVALLVMPFSIYVEVSLGLSIYIQSVQHRKCTNIHCTIALD